MVTVVGAFNLVFLILVGIVQVTETQMKIGRSLLASIVVLCLLPMRQASGEAT